MYVCIYTPNTCTIVILQLMAEGSSGHPGLFSSLVDGDGLVDGVLALGADLCEAKVEGGQRGVLLHGFLYGPASYLRDAE